MEPIILRVPVESTSITSVGYATATQVLEVAFRRGTVYRYLSVPADVFAAFIAAPSKGRYFNANVRDHYRHVRA
jgi:KTSC domain